MSDNETSNPASHRPELFFAIGSLRIGGAERHLADVTRELVRRGWPVTVYSIVETGPLYDALRQSGVTVILPPVESPQSSWSALRRLYRVVAASAHFFMTMQRRRPAIVHFYLPLAYFLGVPLAILAGLQIRVMSRLSLNLYQQEDWRYRLAEPILHRGVRLIIGNSRAILQELETEEGVPASRLALIYSGIDTDAFVRENTRPKTRGRLGIAQNSLTLITVANLIPYKGHKDLIDALAIAKSELPENWRLLVVGRDDGLGDSLRAQASAALIADNIRWLGVVADVADLLNAADIGLLCSHQEGFSIAILEAMAAGLPMIATDVGGNAEAIVDGETGLIVPAHNPKALARAIVTLAKAPAARAAYGNAGRERVTKNFSLANCVDQYEALYIGLLRRSVGASGNTIDA